MGSKKSNKHKNNANNKKKSSRNVKKRNNIAKNVGKSNNKKIIRIESIPEDNKIIKIENIKSKNNNGKRITRISNAKKIATRKAKKSNYLKRINKIYRKIKIYGIQSVLPLKKVIYLATSFLIFILALCFVKIIINKVTYIDLDLIPDKIDQLQTLNFNIDDADEIINSSHAFTGLKTYYEYDFEKVFKLDKSLVKEHYIKFNKENGNTFVVIKATDGNKDKVKEIFDAFFKSMNDTRYEYLDYYGYQIFINSSNNPIVISKIKQSQTRVFNILQEIKKSDIEETLGIKDSLVKRALVKTSMLRSDTCEYIIIKPKNNNAKKKIISIMNNHYRELEEKWKDKDKVNYNLVVNRYFEDYHGYLIYIVSHDNELAIELIKS